LTLVKGGGGESFGGGGLGVQIFQHFIHSS
jgi:hypothetical protein